MDLQKEREAFEQHLTDTGLVEFSDYGFAVDECDEYLHEPTQVAWDSWLIGMNRAKAQDIPEGFVLVPVDTLEECLNWADIAKWDSPSNEVDKKIAHHEAIIESAISAQEPAND